MDVLRGTPSWVYIVFFVVLYYGAASCFKHKETKRSILSTAIIFVLWSLYSLYMNGHYALSLITFSLSLLTGACISYRFLNAKTAIFNDSNENLEIRGSPLMLIVYMAIFSANYIVGYQKATTSEVNSLYIFGMHLLSGLSLGVILIRSGLLIKTLDKALILKNQ